MSNIQFPAGMSKGESLDFLKNMGFNTIDYQICRKEAEVVDFLKARKMDRVGFSIRTQKDGEDNKSNFKYPFYLGIKNEEQFAKISGELLKEGYTLIVSKTLDPEETVCKGTAVINSPENVLVEYITGPGTVRQLEEETPSQSNLYIFDSVRSPAWLREIFFFMVEKLCKENIIVEWSYYPYPVGLLKQQLILWELRPWQ